MLDEIDQAADEFRIAIQFYLKHTLDIVNSLLCLIVDVPLLRPITTCDSSAQEYQNHKRRWNEQQYSDVFYVSTSFFVGFVVAGHNQVSE